VGIFLLIVVFLASLALTVRTWKSYVEEVRKSGDAPGDSEPIEPLLVELSQDSGSSGAIPHTPSTHHGLDCAESHHGVCDVGGHGGLDGGHGGFDFGGHH